jgi:hypothetical protein
MKVFCALQLFAVALVSAQETINYASVSGRVTDQSGAVVEGARHHGSPNRYQLDEYDRHRYRWAFPVSLSRLGPYEIKVNHPVSRMCSRSLTLTVGSGLNFHIADGCGGETSVTVTGEAGVLESVRTQIAGTFPRRRFRVFRSTAEFSGRRAADPGVSPTNTASNQLFAETSAVPAKGFRSAASVTFPTVSLSTAFRKSTMRRASAVSFYGSMWSMNFRL